MSYPSLNDQYPYPISLSEISKPRIKIARPNNSSPLEEATPNISIPIYTSVNRQAKKFSDIDRPFIAAPLLIKPLQLPRTLPKPSAEVKKEPPKSNKAPIWHPDPDKKPGCPPVVMSYSS